jgi:hypothetical protein
MYDCRRAYRCSHCAAAGHLYCRACGLVLCDKHKLCPECDSDELVVPLHRPDANYPRLQTECLTCRERTACQSPAAAIAVESQGIRRP